MIIIKLQGGLGNQLFQYALGRTLEKKYAKEVKYDISFFSDPKKFTPRTFLLNKFNTKISIANDEEIKKVKYPLGAFSKTLFLMKKALNKYLFKKYHISYDSHFLPSIENKTAVYLEGYWQSFRYVEPCLEELRNEIVLKDRPTPVFEKVATEMSQGPSVAIHIRRGDYLNSGGHIGALDMSYYERANAIMMQKMHEVRYYVFTDDTEWVKENVSFLGKANVTFVSDLGLQDYEELILMTYCRHAIIANSSFSWWGAMLNRNPQAIIVCPQDWKNSLLKNDEDLCPERWVRV